MKGRSRGLDTSAHNLGQLQLALVSAAKKLVRQALVHIRAAATETLIFAGAPGFLIRVFLAVRALLPGHRY
jgi:hypothetical protein